MKAFAPMHPTSSMRLMTEPMDPQYGDEGWRELEIKQEREAADTVRALADEIAKHVALVWHWGDGAGGWVFKEITDAVHRRHPRLRPSDDAPAPAKKRRMLPARLRTQVMERDAYRCVRCGSHTDLEVDHIHPVAHGGTDEFSNLQTLCKPCNAAKRDRIQEGP